MRYVHRCRIELLRIADVLSFLVPVRLLCSSSASLSAAQCHAVLLSSHVGFNGPPCQVLQRDPWAVAKVRKVHGAHHWHWNRIAQGALPMMSKGAVLGVD